MAMEMKLSSTLPSTGLTGHSGRSDRWFSASRLAST
jgi:hypothetical protein